MLADTAGRLHSQSAPDGGAEEGAARDHSASCRPLQTRAAGARCQSGARTRSPRRGSSTEAVGVTGLVLTKLDGTARGGIVIAIAQRAAAYRSVSCPVSASSLEDFGEFDAASLCRRRSSRDRRQAPAPPPARRARHDPLSIQVSKRYPNGREALTNVSFNIHNGEMVFLTGRSGAGKSTVLKLIALLERPTRGNCGGARPQYPAPCQDAAHRRLPARRHLGVVFQDHRPARRPAGVRQRRAAVAWPCIQRRR